jgi:predicted DCC family thiol-disulfide oxidoreductase YuxK
MKWVLFFDGDCAFCSRSVKQAVALDKHERLAFAPLQGKLAHELGFEKHAAAAGGTMVLLRESDGMVFMRSDALIELARVLGGGWRVMTLAKLVPKKMRDWVYGWVADHRLRFMGKQEACMVPDVALHKRLRD